tara:strand:- start:395 stop:559 length:165 start_codon:yes stop_codon:yes gene_type:complete
MKRLMATLASVVLPGVGHVLYGSFGWATIFIGAACLFGPVANILATLHVLLFVD